MGDKELISNTGTRRTYNIGTVVNCMDKSVLSRRSQHLIQKRLVFVKEPEHPTNQEKFTVEIKTFGLKQKVEENPKQSPAQILLNYSWCTYI